MSKQDDDRYDYLEYQDQLNDDQREWLKQFYEEYYFNGKPGEGKEKIITSEEMQQEANRINNSYASDLLFRAKKEGALAQVNDNYHQFMQDASDDFEWEDAYKQGGFELAIKVITGQALRDLKNENIQQAVVLTRYYEKRDRLRRQVNKEKRK